MKQIPDELVQMVCQLLNKAVHPNATVEAVNSVINQLQSLVPQNAEQTKQE